MKIFIALIICLFTVSVGNAAEKFSLLIKAGDNSFSAELNDNVTVNDIVKKLPLSLSMQRYAEHEFYSELPFRPEFAEERTSLIKAGHLYYWDGWNAFVINYEDTNIAPYKVVHLGSVNEASEICKMLREAADNLQINVELRKEND